MKNDQGAVDYARTQLAYCRIAAPFDSRFGLRLVDPGNVVQANSATPLVVLTEMQPITVVFSVVIPTSAIQHNGAKAFVYLVSGNTAHVHEVSPGAADAG